MLRTNQDGIDLIKYFESLRLKAYKDAVGIWTIGYGSTRNVQPGMVITEPEANERLLEDISETEKEVNNVIKVQLTDNQFSALVSFTFNLGIHNLERSTLLKDVNGGNFTSAANEFTKWDKAGGRTLSGLLARREKERELFLKP